MTGPDYLLDTDTIVALLRDRPSAARGRFRRTLAEGASLAITSITSFELSSGIARSGQERVNGDRLRVLLSSGIEGLPFPEGAARIAGAIRAELEAAGRSIGSSDLLIAGHARHLGRTLVTGNAGEFGRVPDLRVENWIVGV